MDKLLKKYRDQFGENFPIMLMMCEEDSKIIKIIEKCLSSNKPFDAKIKSGVVY